MRFETGVANDVAFGLLYNIHTSQKYRLFLFRHSIYFLFLFLCLFLCLLPPPYIACHSVPPPTSLLVDHNHPANERVEQKHWIHRQSSTLLVDNLLHEHHGSSRTPHEPGSNHKELEQNAADNP